MTSQSTISYRSVNGIGTVILQRPPTNAMTPRMVRELRQLVGELVEQTDLHAVIVTGAGGPGSGFCPGADIKRRGTDEALAEEAADGPPPEDLAQLARLIRELPMVTVAAINGAVAGAGLGLALACDVRVAADSANFATAFLARGLSGDMGVWWTLVHAVGPARAREVGLLVDKFSAAQAAAFGLVSAVWPDAEFAEGVESLANRLRGMPRPALWSFKANVIDAESLLLGPYLDAEMARHLALSGSPESRARFEQFLANRSTDPG